MFSDFVKNIVVSKFPFKSPCLLSRLPSLFFGGARGIVGRIHYTPDAPRSLLSRATRARLGRRQYCTAMLRGKLVLVPEKETFSLLDGIVYNVLIKKT